MAAGVWLALAGHSGAAETAENPDLRRFEPAAKTGPGTLLARGLLGGKDANHLFYLPTKDEPATPAKWGFRYEAVEFASEDGTRLHGWFLPARARDAKATVVFSHGNAGSIGHHIGFVMWLVEAGYHVLMYDYRGFGRSGGSVDRRGMLDDVRAAFLYAASRPEVDGGRLVSYGHSMGGAKSVTALALAPVRGLRAVVVDATFASYRSMARIVVGRFAEDLVTDDWAPKDHVGKLAPVPLLAIHGDKDEVVPLAQGRALFEAAAEPKTWFQVKQAGHGDALVREGGAYRKRMLTWLEERLSAQP